MKSFVFLLSLLTVCQIVEAQQSSNNRKRKNDPQNVVDATK